MSSDDGTKPWDAPDPSQLRITTAPAARRARKGAPRPPEPSVPVVSPAPPPPPPQLRPPGSSEGPDPTEAPPRPSPRPPRRPSARVGRPTGEFVPEGAEAPMPPPSEPVAVDAPPIPRPQYPFGAPLPARIDTRAGVPRLQVGPGADWRDIDEPEPVVGSAREPTLPRWALAAGSVLGGGGLLLGGVAIGVVVGSAFIDAFTIVPEDPDAPVTAAPPPAELTLPAFPGGRINALAGTDALVPTYPAQEQLPPPLIFVEISLPEQTLTEEGAPKAGSQSEPSNVSPSPED